MITVIETWFLKPECGQRALELMQEMDEIVEPGAHESPGWCGHAVFLQAADDPAQVLMIYPWRDRESHVLLTRSEDPLLEEFHRRHCLRQRTIQYFEEIPVEHKLSLEPSGRNEHAPLW